MFLYICLLVFSTITFSGAIKNGIVGGEEVKPHSRPYMVSLQFNKQHTCGGMLIRRDFVLTSAHCVDACGLSGKKRLEAVLGAHNISQKEQSQQRIQVKKWIKHPSYQECQNNWSFDIMLLKLKTKAKITKAVNLIALPEENDNIPANQKCSIAGWGMTVPDKHRASNVLKEVTLKLQFSFECKNIWKDYFDSKRMICSVSDGKRAFCQGDSGSPLICDNKPQGMAAYTASGNCANRKFPEVYVKIGYFISWIKKVISSR